MLVRIVHVFFFLISVGVALFSSNCLAAEPLPLHFAQAPTTETPMPTAEEFKRLHAYIVSEGEILLFPWQIGVHLGWGRAHIDSWRRGFAQRRVRDGAVLRQYAADVPKLKLPRPVIVLSQLIPGDTDKDVPPDTTLSFVYDDNGRIIRTFEMFPEANNKVAEIKDGSFDQLGYEVWRFVLSRVDKAGN